MSQPKEPVKAGSIPPMGDHVAQGGRKTPRVDLWIKGPTLREAGGTPVKVKIHDISTHGFRTEWPYKLRRGDRVWLRITGLEALPALVAWEQNYTIGCQFEAPLHPAVFERVVESLKRSG